MALILQHQTQAEFIVRFWRHVAALHASGDKLSYHRLIWWIWAKIQANDLTSNQVRLGYNSYFNKSLDTAQWNTLVTNRFIPIKDRYLALKAETDV